MNASHAFLPSIIRPQRTPHLRHLPRRLQIQFSHISGPVFGVPSSPALAQCHGGCEFPAHRAQLSFSCVDSIHTNEAPAAVQHLFSALSGSLPLPFLDSVIFSLLRARSIEDIHKKAEK